MGATHNFEQYVGTIVDITKRTYKGMQKVIIKPNKLLHNEVVILHKDILKLQVLNKHSSNNHEEDINPFKLKRGKQEITNIPAPTIVDYIRPFHPEVKQFVE